MEHHQRLFFALLPPNDIKKKITNFRTELQKNHQLTESAGIKLVPVDNFHLTLLFLGELPSAAIPKIIACADKIKATKFELNLHTVGHFKRSMVLWVGVKKTPYELEYLIDGLKVNMREVADLDNIARPASFIPHLSLIKKLEHIYQYPNILKQYINIVWPVDRFYLVKSLTNDNFVTYEIVSEFILS